MKTLQLKTHLGLGDHFVLQGMVNLFLLSSGYDKVVIYTKAAHVPTVRRLHSASGDLVDIVAHEEYVAPADLPGADRIVSLGYFAGDAKPKFDKQHWDREFYRQADVEFIERWRLCSVPNKQPLPKRQEYTIRHHDPKRGYVIEGIKPTIDIDPTSRENLLDWVPELCGAQEIHCIDSCVMNLVESLFHCRQLRRDVKLFYHKYARPDAPPTVLAPWTVIR